MRALLMGVLAGCVALSGGQERFGLSSTQILKYSPDKWIEYYQNKVKQYDPTVDHAACAVYAACIRERFAPKLKKLSNAEQTHLANVEKQAVNFKNACFAIQYAAGGGGTLYSHLQGNTVVDDAQLVESLLNRAKAPYSTEAAIAASMKAISAWLTRQASPGKDVQDLILGTGGTMVDYHKDVSEAMASLAAIKKLITKRPLNERAHLVGYLRRWSNPIVGP